MTDPDTPSELLLNVEGLTTEFRSGGRSAAAVRGVSFGLAPRGTLAILGESGSGKTLTALSIMRLVEQPGRITAGHIAFKGRDLLAASDKDMRAIRGAEIAMVQQDPFSSLNPVYTVGAQVREAVRAHQPCGRSDAQEKALELLRAVGIPSPQTCLHQYPHTLSGGMAQRVVIAMALANEPDLLILDEPTSALDATVQAQIVALITGLRQAYHTAIILITHDFGLARDLCADTIIMYGGHIVESGPTRDILDRPSHPYTRALLAALPGKLDDGQPLPTIPGSAPSIFNMPHGCPFAPRCEHSFVACTDPPPTVAASTTTRVACWLHVATAARAPGISR